MTAPAAQTPRVYRLTADLAPETEIGDVDVLGNQARLVSLVEQYLNERGFSAGPITPMGLFLREGPIKGGPNWMTTELLVVVKGDAEDIERAVNAFVPPKSTYPRTWWELATTELINARREFLDARREHARKLRSKGAQIKAPTPEELEKAAGSRGATSGGRHAAASVNPEVEKRLADPDFDPEDLF